jgi:hypothetical protein
MPVLRKTIQDAHNLAESKGFKFMSTEFTNTKIKYLWGCTESHQWSVTYDNIRGGSGCPHCSGKARITIEDAYKLAKIKGFNFLSLQFNGVDSKYLWRCAKGHEWSTTFTTIKKSGCPDCANKSRSEKNKGKKTKLRKNIQDAHNLAKSRGYKFLSPEFKGSMAKHLWRCGEGHEWSARYSSIQSGRGCPKCQKVMFSKTIQDAYDLAKIRGFKFLSTKFLGVESKYLWECKKRHKWSQKYSAIKRGNGCPQCRNLKLKITIEDAHKLAKSNGFKFISSEFNNVRTKHLWECSKGHQWFAKYDSIKHKKSGCPHCAGLSPKTIEHAHNLAESRGFKFLSNEFMGTQSKYLWDCDKGHKFMSTYARIQQGHGCGKCYNKLFGEKLTRYCFVKILNTTFNKIKPNWIRNPKTGQKLELDGYNEQMLIAFEHQGEQHEKDCRTSNLFYDPEQLVRDEIKRQKCKEYGIVLIEVPQIGLRLKVKDVVPFLLSEFDKHNIAYPESAKSFQIDMKEFRVQYMN